jgi:hypothetical protein
MIKMVYIIKLLTYNPRFTMLNHMERKKVTQNEFQKTYMINKKQNETISIN